VPAATLAVALCLGAAASAAESVKFASTRSLANAPYLIAEVRGYFAAEGLETTHIISDASGPITLAVTSGDADIGATGLSGAFFNLAAQGQLRIIAGYVTDSAGFPGIAYVASNRAWNSGLKSLKDIGGHSVGVTQVGTGLEFSVALLAEKLGFDMRTVRVMPLQSYPNELSAATGNNLDVAVVPTNYAVPAVASGNVKLLGNLGDVVSIQTGMMFVSAKTADQRGDVIQKFLRAFRHGARDYHDAFVGPDNRPATGPDAEQLIALLAKAADEPVTQVKADINYIDPDARVRVSDVTRQAAWYQAQGMVKGKLDGSGLVDRRYAKLFDEP
jgi:NitT/TauT family transport system substrate-binding protein